MSDDFLEFKLNKMYSSYKAMEPSRTIIDTGKNLAEIVYPDLKRYFGDDFHIAIGYHCKNLKADIAYIKPYNTRLTLFFNLYLTEYIADYLLYLEYRNEMAFRYLFGKQMRNFELYSENQEAAAFFNRMYSDAKDHFRDKTTEYLNMALAISIFVIFHEWTHHAPDLIEQLQIELNFLKEKGKLSELTPADITEISCDCAALALIDLIKLEDMLGISKEKLIGVSDNTMILINYYNCLPEFTIEAVNSGNHTAIKHVAEMVDTLKRRATGLLALVSNIQGSGDIFQNVDLPATRNIVDATGELLGYTSKLFRNSINDEIKAFYELPKEEKAKYYVTKPKDIWFYYL